MFRGNSLIMGFFFFFFFRSDCCKQDMVLKRGTEGCHCVYPIKLDLQLLNVSQNPNWSLFLQQFASGLGLLASQIEMINFYWLGVTRLNISMDVIPRVGISFSTMDASALNSTLVKHKVHIDVGDYKLLNFTWFEAPAPSPGVQFFLVCTVSMTLIKINKFCFVILKYCQYDYRIFQLKLPWIILPVSYMLLHSFQRNFLYS